MRQNSTVDRRALFIFSGVLALCCAGQAPPPGGPPDTAPPTVIRTYPEGNTTGFRDQRIALEFSEYVERRSVEESIFVSPAVSSLEFDWRGQEVEVRFGESLRPNVTYVVTLGTDVIDVRNRNHMAESFALAFSTGMTLDSASLRGKVYDPKPGGVTLFAFNLDDRLQDTLNPAVSRPDYVTQTGGDGSFKLDHLAWGTYRLFAVRDEYRNFLYDIQVDQIGMAAEDFELSSQNPAAEDIQFRLTKEDTTHPFLLDAQAVDKNTLRVRFSEPIDPSDLSRGPFSVVDTIANTQFSKREVYFPITSPAVCYVRTVSQDSTRWYRITAGDVRDTAGNIINPHVNSALMQGSSRADTMPPQILVVSVQDSSRNVPYDASFGLVFSEGVRKKPFELGFGLLDSSAHEVEGTFKWRNFTAVRFQPHTPLLPRAWYRIRLPLGSVQDFGGNQTKDSVFLRSFQTVDPRKLGSIRGRLEDPLEGDRTPLQITAQSISDKLAAPHVQTFSGAGPFSFEELMEGQYVLSGFRDGDHTGNYSVGRSFPFTRSERFAIYPDTIKVRARWPVEGIILKFGKY